ncbi:MAG: hypothetical protein U0Q15_14965 [Kineosporiaceae bacterium]
MTTTPAVSATPTPTASPSVSATPTPSAAGRSKKTPPGREQEPKGRKAKAPGHRMQPAASPAPTSSTAS